MRLLVLVAIVIGVVAGALACTGGLASGAGHAHAPVEVSQHDAGAGHAGHAGHARGADSAEAPSSDRAPADSDASAGAHPGMSCVVGFELRFVGDESATTCDQVEPSPAAALPGRLDGPEPPVPRSP
jgi:hypothetical protein